MSTLSVSKRLNGTIRALIIESEDLRRAGRDQDAKAMAHYAELIGDIQRQAANEEEAREVPV